MLHETGQMYVTAATVQKRDKNGLLNLQEMSTRICEPNQRRPCTRPTASSSPVLLLLMLLVRRSMRLDLFLQLVLFGQHVELALPRTATRALRPVALPVPTARLLARSLVRAHSGVVVKVKCARLAVCY